MIVEQVDLYSPVGGFGADTFKEWIGREVDVTGLDPAYRHILMDVANSADGTTSTLTVHTYGDLGVDLTADLSIRVSTPKAQVRAYLADQPATLVTTAWLDRFLTVGELVTVNGARHRVVSIDWPYRRQPRDPSITEDYQAAVIQPEPDTPLVRPVATGGFLGLDTPVVPFPGAGP